MNKNVLIFVFSIIISLGFSQNYKVNSEKLNIRSGPSTKFEILHQLTFGEEVLVVEKNQSGWWKIKYSNINGFVASKNLKEENYNDWEKKTYISGTTPDCENITPEYDYKIDNYLKIQVGGGTDVVVKLMQKSHTEAKCIRVVYINSGDTYYIKNIPEGLYYLKIAYGKDYRQSIVNNKCKIKFIQNPIYEKGSKVLDFYVKTDNNGISVPSFELKLDVITKSTKDENFNTGNISEEEFNN
jgi:hypothetical protein